MSKKIILTILIAIILIQATIPIKVNGFIETGQVISYSAQIDNYKSEEIALEENEMTGLNLVTGLLIEPTVEFFTFVLDSIMSVLSGVMTQQPIQFVMVKQEEKDTLPDYGDADKNATFTINDMKPYESATGKVEHLKFPRFTYSPEEIFSGDIDMLDINFIKESNSDTNWLKIRKVVSGWYKTLRMVAIVGLLSVLIYIGIKIILSSNTKDKAKYKQMILSWFIAVFLAFFMHYIMAFILAVVEQFIGVLKGVTTAIEVVGGQGITFKTNLMGLARFQMQQQHFSGKIGHLVIYTALVVFTFKFTFVYLKRVLRMAFLTVISPIVAITYPLDKMDGDAKGFKMWLKEYTYNAILQPMHALLYYILVTTSLTLAANNPVYGIAALMFMAEAEKLLKRIFGFDKARAGTVGGVAGAFATGAVVSALTNYVKDPMHPLSGGKGKSKSGGNKTKGGSSSTYGDYDIEDWVPFRDDTTEYDDLFPMLGIETTYQNNEGQGRQYFTNDNNNGQDVENLPENTIIPNIEKFFARYRKTIPISINDVGEFYIDGDSSYTIEDALKMLADYEKTGRSSMLIPGFENLNYDELKNVLFSRIDANESDFIQNNILLQYIDGDRRTSRELMEEIIRLYNAEEFSLNPIEGPKQYQNLLKRLKLRMAQNEYIENNGGVLSLRQQESYRIENLKNTEQQQDESGTYLDFNRFEISAKSQIQLADKAAIEQVPQKNKNGDLEQIQESQQKEIEPNKKPTIAEQKVQEQANKPIYKPNKREVEQDEKKLRREESWENFKGKRIANGLKNVAVQTGKTIIKPVWDTEKGLDWKYNGKRLAGNILKGVGGVTVGVAAAAVQAGISITDGKYKPAEGVATVAAGMAGVSKIAKTSEQLREERTKDQQTLEKYSEQWFNRDDVISNYNIEYPGEGKAMRKRAVNNYVSRGITDFKDQKEGMKYADVLMKERGLNQEEADKMAIATIQYKRNLTRTNSYMVLFDEKRREKYINNRIDTYTGSASRDSIKRLHDDLIENVRDFDRVNS